MAAAAAREHKQQASTHRGGEGEVRRHEGKAERVGLKQRGEAQM